MSPTQVKTPYVPQGDVEDLPNYATLTRLLATGEDVRFILTLGTIKQEVKVVESAGHFGQGHAFVWWGVVCPVERLETGEGSRAIKVTRQNNTVTYI